MGRIAELVFKDAPPHASSRVALAMRCAGVTRSPDFERIYELPRRVLNFDEVEDVSIVFAQPNGTMKLRPVQSAALIEAPMCGGIVVGAGVGWGKTLILLLLPDAVEAKNAVLLVKPDLKRQLVEDDIPAYSKHFKIPTDRFTVVAYSELSSTKKGDVLDRIKPDWIFADEAHSLSRKDSARSRRFDRYMDAHPECRFGALSGSFLNTTIRNFQHLWDRALRTGSPLPHGFNTVRDWADAIDPPTNGKEQKPPGALTMFCNEGESVRSGFNRRCAETPGVILTQASSCDKALYIMERDLKAPKVVLDEIRKLQETWVIGDEEVLDAMNLTKFARQLAAGFYYRWKWPRDAKGNAIIDRPWLEARRAWFREARGYLHHHNRENMDSLLLVTNAAMKEPCGPKCRGFDGKICQCGRWGALAWAAWDKERHKKKPPTEAVWISDYVVQDALRWAKKAVKEAGGGIIWYHHVPLGEAIAKAGGWRLFGQGADASTTNPKENPIVVCSIKSQGEGKNLQAWSRGLVTSPPSNATTWEQMLGREHREGQEADEVRYDVNLQTEENDAALDKAIEIARFKQETQGQKQKLLIGQIVRRRKGYVGRRSAA
jgi:hypothetical protein